MSPTNTVINNKTVQLSQPYSPQKISGAALVGRTQQCQMVLASWLSQEGLPPLAPLLVGPPGVGKNRLVYELAQITNKALYVVQGHEDITPEDLACAVRFSDDVHKKMDYLLAPLATAMMTGSLCFIDEIGKLRAKVLAPLASVLDERRYLDSTLLGERIYAQAGFRLIAATNTVDLEDNRLPGFIHSRLRPLIEVGHPPRKELEQIIQTRFSRVKTANQQLLPRFWALWREYWPERAPSPRDVLYLFGLTLNLADAEAAECSQGDSDEWTGYSQAVGQPQQRHLEAAFHQLFLTGHAADV